MSIDVDKRPVQENGIQERENIGTASNIYVYIVHESCKPTSICDDLIRVWPDKFWFAAANIRDQDDDYLVNNTLETFEDWSATRKKKLWQRVVLANLVKKSCLIYSCQI